MINRQGKVDVLLKKGVADVKMVFYLPEDFWPLSEEQSVESMAQLSLSPAAVIFEKPVDKRYRHRKPL